MSTIVTGSIAYDRIMDFPGYFKDEIMPEKIHTLNVSFFVRQLKESFGGTAGNIAYNLSLLGFRPSILCNVGAKDFLLYKKWLVKNNIDLSLVKILPHQQTASAYIITDKADNQIAGFFPGAMSRPLTADLKSQKSNLKSELAIVSPQNPADMTKLPVIFKKQNIPYIFDPGQQVTSLSGVKLCQAISGSKVLIGNDYEIALVSKKTLWPMSILLKKTEIVITTLGSQGAVIRSGSKVFRTKAAKKKKVVDPTGAGDAYRAGFIAGLIKKYPLAKVNRLAVVVAAYAVEQYGTQNHHFAWREVAKRYRQNFGEQL